MKKNRILAVCVALSVFLGGCAYRHYLGIHGPSIKKYADTHRGYAKDEECLSCHHPDRDPKGPPTSHPNFKGCLKCHNDDLQVSMQILKKG